MSAKRSTPKLKSDDAIRKSLGDVEILIGKIKDETAWRCIKKLKDVCEALHERIIQEETSSNGDTK